MSTPSTLPRLADAELRATLLDDNQTARREFVEALADAVEEVVRGAISAFQVIDRLNRMPSQGQRHDHVRLFVHTAFSNLVSSTNLLVAGFPLASGALMRHYGEAVAMALLCLDPESRVLEEFDQKKGSYPVHQAVDRLRRRKQWNRIRRLIDAHPNGWEFFSSLDRLWDHFSHAGAFSLGFQFKFAANEALVIGAEFDADKLEEFKKDLGWKRASFNSLEGMALALVQLFSSSPTDPSTPRGLGLQ